MTTSAAIERRELAHRSSNGIDVALLWTGSTSMVAVVVLDTHSGEELEFEVDGSRALDAFNHPYAYAATVRVRGRAADAAGSGAVSSPPPRRRAATLRSGPRY